MASGKGASPHDDLDATEQSFVSHLAELRTRLMRAILCVLAVLLASMALGAGRGLVFEVLSLLAWGVAAVLARLFAADAAAYLPLGALQGSLRYAASFVLVFIAAAFLCGWVAALGSRLPS